MKGPIFVSKRASKQTEQRPRTAARIGANVRTTTRTRPRINKTLISNSKTDFKQATKKMLLNKFNNKKIRTGRTDRQRETQRQRDRASDRDVGFHIIFL